MRKIWPSQDNCIQLKDKFASCEFGTPTCEIKAYLAKWKWNTAAQSQRSPTCESDFATCELGAQRAKMDSKLRNQLARFSQVTMQQDERLGFSSLGVRKAGDVQIVTRSGRVAQPTPVDKPFAGTDVREDVQKEDDEILRQLRTTQAHISIWSLLASSSTHRDALIKALSQIRVDTATTPEGLIHFLMADRATCIVFSDDDLPPEGLDHVRPLFIDVACSGRRVPSVLLDNGSALNVCPLVIAIALGFSPFDFGPSTQIVRAYDGTQRTVMGTLTTHVMIGSVKYSILFQKVKFIHEGHIITIQSDRDVVTSFEPVLQISHNEDDLHLTGFTFDEVQVISLEDDSRDMLGIGSSPAGAARFAFTVDHDIPYGLGYTPSEEDARHMARLHRDRVRAHLSGVPFDYPLCPNTFQLANYFTRGSGHAPRTEEVDRVPKAVEI
ncbi:hypothetical protein CK203_053593 [Vitis vinifera]|uniref:Uncharacterized protein n=1 Tax=Vitis vinifera TaxID=29760 RepID=A0A438HIF6_VITVI|nr:hypothetical protein CK203_053593 [Vitis vinifera]